MPVYNEKGTILDIYQRVKLVDIRKEIIIIDDGSTDGTREVLQNLSDADTTKIFFHEGNRGKGAAVRTGLMHASGDIIIIQDADLEYNPAEYPKLVKPILTGKADVVYGSRFVPGERLYAMSFWNMLGNKFLTMLSNKLTNLNLTDVETCYKVFRREVLEKISIEEDRFGFDPEITAKIARQNLRIYEIGISYTGRTYQEGKKIGWKDGISALRCILKYNLWP